MLFVKFAALCPNIKIQEMKIDLKNLGLMYQTPDNFHVSRMPVADIKIREGGGGDNFTLIKSKKMPRKVRPE